MGQSSKTDWIENQVKQQPEVQAKWDKSTNIIQKEWASKLEQVNKQLTELYCQVSEVGLSANIYLILGCKLSMRLMIKYVTSFGPELADIQDQNRRNN